MIKFLAIIGIFFILFVAAYDIYVSIQLQSVLYENELNPIGRWLIELNNGSVALFMAVKLFGTSLTSIILTLLFMKYRKFGLTIIVGLDILALLLLLYLTC